MNLFDSSVLAHAVKWDMPSFLQAYTLHDSVLKEFRYSPHGGIAVSIDWDLHWNETIPDDFCNLAIVFHLAYSLVWTQGSWHYSTLNGATSQLVPMNEREAMLSDGSVQLEAFQKGADIADIQPCCFDESLTRTEFEGFNWSRITILHNGEVRFLCFDESGAFFSIPKSS